MVSLFLHLAAEEGKKLISAFLSLNRFLATPLRSRTGYEKTDELMQQAQKCISDVVFNPIALHDQYGNDAGAGGAAYNPNSQYGGGEYGAQGQGSDEHGRQAEFGVNGGGHHRQQDSINYGGDGGGGGYQDDSWRGHQSDAYNGPDPYHGGVVDQYASASDDPYSAARNYNNTPYLPEIATASSLAASLPAGARAGPAGSETEGESVVDVYNAVLSSDPSGLAVPKLDTDANRSSLAYMDEGAWGNQQSGGATDRTEDLAGDNSIEARERAQAEEDERLEREKSEAEEVERAELEKRSREKEQSMRAPYRYSGSGSPGQQQEVGTSAAHEQYQSRDSAPPHVEDLRSAAHDGLPYSPPPPTHNKYYPEAIERPYIAREDDGAYHGPTNSPPPSGAPSANAQPPQQQSYEQHQQHTSLPPISTVPPAAANTSLPLSPRSPSPPATPTQFEPQQQQKKPIMIRGESALGSKYGDVFVPNRAAVDGGALNSSSGSSVPQNGSTTPSYLSSAVGGGGSSATGASGYFRGNTGADDRSTGSAEPRKVNAGAFRRAQPIGGGAGGLGGPQYGATMAGPSQADAIRDQYRSTTLATAGEGELPGSASPRFDVSFSSWALRRARLLTLSFFDRSLLCKSTSLDQSFNRVLAPSRTLALSLSSLLAPR